MRMPKTRGCPYHCDRAELFKAGLRFKVKIRLRLGYLKDSNAAAHSVDTGIS